MSAVAAIILAAGGSSRFGRIKQLLELEGSNLIERTIIAARDAACKPVIVVTGSNSSEIATAIQSENICIVENPEWSRGIGTSIRTGLQRLIELAPGIKAVVLLVSDQPSVTASVVSSLIELWRTTAKPIVASSYSGTLGVPALFDASCLEELLQLNADSGAKPIIFKDRNRVAELPFSAGATDIDTPADYENFKNSRSMPRQPPSLG